MGAESNHANNSKRASNRTVRPLRASLENKRALRAWIPGKISRFPDSGGKQL